MIVKNGGITIILPFVFFCLIVMIAYLYIACLFLLLIFGLHSLYLVYKFLTLETTFEELPEINPNDKLPLVTVQLPVYNEPVVIERLIRSVCAIDYPREILEIQVLDDSSDNTTTLAEKCAKSFKNKGYDIKVIRRGSREGFKAGALANGLKTAKGDFVAIFDADFVPDKNFLMDNIHFFKDSRIALVQTKWRHFNDNMSLLTLLQSFSLNGHFLLEQLTRNRSGLFINFNGASGIWRKEAIIDAGNWHGDTLAEDLDLSYRAQLKGWKFHYVNKEYSGAELPSDINSYKQQQYRWTKGAVECALKLMPSVLKSGQKWNVKLEAFFHLSSNVVFPLLLLISLMNIPVAIFGSEIASLEVFYPIMPIFYVALLSSFLFYLFAQRDTGLGWFRKIILFPLFLAGTLGLSINNTKAVFEALIGKKTKFKRTPKMNYSSSTAASKPAFVKKRKSLVFFELSMALYYAAGIAASFYFIDIMSIPFQLLFFIGFGSAGIMSLNGFRETEI